MSTVVFWAIVGAALALRLSPLWGIIVGVVAAVIGMAVPVSVVAASGAVLLGSSRAPGGGTGPARIAEAVCIVIFAACVIMLLAVIYALTTGTMPFSRR